MKILHLTAENVKKLKVVEITPKTDVVQITGKNGSGKTSVMDSIWWALDGVKNIQAVPIRKGEESARIQLNLGEIIVTRKFSDKGSSLVVETAEGARFPSPQKMLDDLIGELSFDPLEFSRMEPAAQYRELKRIVKLDVDIDELDKLNKADYEARTVHNRNAKDYATRAAGFSFNFEPMEAPIDSAALVQELAESAEFNANIERRKENRAAVQRQIEADDAEIIELQERIKALQTRVADAEKKLADAEPLPEPKNVDDLRAKIADATAKNEEHQRRAEHKKLVEQAKDSEKKAEELTEAMKARDTAKETALAAAKMPVAGIGLADGGVTLNGLPFVQASSAEQLRTSIAIAMAANPKLRVIRVKDGSLLDDDGFAMLEEMARENDYQIWVERVDTSGKIGIVMEDGTAHEAGVATGGVVKMEKPLLVGEAPSGESLAPARAGDLFAGKDGK